MSYSTRVFGESASSSTTSGKTFASSIDNGEDFSCAILASGNVRCWGKNEAGQLGLASTTIIGDNEQPWQDVNLGQSKAVAISSGTAHSCVILDSGNVRCWGANRYGQLGLGNTTNIGDDESPTTNVDLGGQIAIAISSGGDSTCVILIGGDVRCWGFNFNGQLGLGNTSTIGDDESPTTNVNLGGQTSIAISTSGASTCVILIGGDVRCWGYNPGGQLGLGNTTQIGDDESPTTNVNLGGQTAIAISSSYDHTCVVLTNGKVRCWGRNDFGQLGLGNTTQIGDNENPTTNVDLGPVDAIAVSTRGTFTCIITTTNRARCWGENRSGWLGMANAATIGAYNNPANNVNLGSVTVVALTTSSTTVCVLFDNGGLRCWGNNTHGQLGIGNQNTIGDNENPTVNVSFYDQSLVGPTTSTVAPTVAPTTTATTGVTNTTYAPVITTTTPSVTMPKLTTSKSATAKSIAAYAKITIASTSKVSLKVVSIYAKYCKVSGTTLKGLKTGSCKVTVTVTPKKGKATSKTVTLKVTK